MSSQQVEPWRDEVKMETLYNKRDLTDREIAEKFGCSRSTVTDWRNKFGIKSDYEVDQDLNDKERLKKLYLDQGYTTYEIADEFDCCEYTVRHRLKKFNIERRSKSDYVDGLLKNADELRRLYHGEHMTMSDIAELVEVGPSGVRHWMKKHGIETKRGPKEHPELSKNKQELEKLYIEDELSTREIAEMFEVDESTIYRHLEKNGVDIRSLSEAWAVKESQQDRLYYGAEWSKRREKAIQSADECCEVCEMDRDEHKNKFGFDLHVHHIRKMRKFESTKEANKLKNLLSVCVRCHRKWENIPLAPETK